MNQPAQDQASIAYRRDYRDLFNASPYIRLIGMRLEEFGEGLSRLELTLAERHMNLQGTVQGGVCATLIDSAMSSAIRGLMQPGQRMVTVELKLNYLSAAREKELLIAEGELLQFGSRLAVVRALIKTGDGRSVAAGQGTFALLSPDRGGNGADTTIAQEDRS